MTNKPKISTTQLIFLVVGSAILSPYTFLPVLNTPPANQDSWIVAILSTVYIVVLSLPILFFTNKYRGLSLNEISELILGKVIGKIVCVILALFFLFICILYTLMVIIFISTYLFPWTPVWALLIYGLIPVAYLVSKGAGTIGKISTFIVPYILLTILLFFIMGMDQFQIDILRPILADSNFWDINKGAFLTASRFPAVFIFIVFNVYFDEKVNINKTFFKSLGIFAIFFLLILFPTVLVLGFDISKHSWNPYFLYSRFVKVYDFIQRVESLNTLSWLLGVMLQLGVYGCMANELFSRVFKLKNQKVLILPFTILILLVSLFPPLLKSNVVEFIRSDNVYPLVCFPFIFVIPFIMLIVYFIKELIKKHKEKKQLNT